MKNEKTTEEIIEIVDEEEYYVVYIKSTKAFKHSKKVNTLEGLKKIYGEKGRNTTWKKINQSSTFHASEN